MTVIKRVRNDAGDEITIHSRRGYMGAVYTVYRNGAYETESESLQVVFDKVRELGGKP